MKIIFDSEEQKEAFFKLLYCCRPCCPDKLYLNDHCEGILCHDCWKKAVTMEVRDYTTRAKNMISSGEVVKSEFYNILVQQLADDLRKAEEEMEENTSLYKPCAISCNGDAMIDDEPCVSCNVYHKFKNKER